MKSTGAFKPPRRIDSGPHPPKQTNGSPPSIALHSEATDDTHPPHPLDASREKSMNQGAITSNQNQVSKLYHRPPLVPHPQQDSLPYQPHTSHHDRPPHNVASMLSPPPSTSTTPLSTPKTMFLCAENYDIHTIDRSLTQDIGTFLKHWHFRPLVVNPKDLCGEVNLQGESDKNKDVTAWKDDAPLAAFKAGLNREQYTAVSLPVNTASVVVAGPGSGKTRVLIHRMAYLMGELKVSGLSILAITFTNKAAREILHRLRACMKAQNQMKRLEEMLSSSNGVSATPTGQGIGDSLYDENTTLPIVRTFHGLGRMIISMFGHLLILATSERIDEGCHRDTSSSTSNRNDQINGENVKVVQGKMTLIDEKEVRELSKGAWIYNMGKGMGKDSKLEEKQKFADGEEELVDMDGLGEQQDKQGQESNAVAKEDVDADAVRLVVKRKIVRPIDDKYTAGIPVHRSSFPVSTIDSSTSSVRPTPGDNVTNVNGTSQLLDKISPTTASSPSIGVVSPPILPTPLPTPLLASPISTIPQSDCVVLASLKTAIAIYEAHLSKEELHIQDVLTADSSTCPLPTTTLSISTPTTMDTTNSMGTAAPRPTTNVTSLSSTNTTTPSRRGSTSPLHQAWSMWMGNPSFLHLHPPSGLDWPSSHPQACQSNKSRRSDGPLCYHLPYRLPVGDVHANYQKSGHSTTLTSVTSTFSSSLVASALPLQWARILSAPLIDVAQVLQASQYVHAVLKTKAEHDISHAVATHSAHASSIQRQSPMVRTQTTPLTQSSQPSLLSQHQTQAFRQIPAPTGMAPRADHQQTAGQSVTTLSQLPRQPRSLYTRPKQLPTQGSTLTQENIMSQTQQPPTFHTTIKPLSHQPTESSSQQQTRLLNIPLRPSYPTPTPATLLKSHMISLIAATMPPSLTSSFDSPPTLNSSSPSTPPLDSAIPSTPLHAALGCLSLPRFLPLSYLYSPDFSLLLDPPSHPFSATDMHSFVSCCKSFALSPLDVLSLAIIIALATYAPPAPRTSPTHASLPTTSSDIPTPTHLPSRTAVPPQATLPTSKPSLYSRIPAHHPAPTTTTSFLHHSFPSSTCPSPTSSPTPPLQYPPTPPIPASQSWPRPSRKDVTEIITSAIAVTHHHRLILTAEPNELPSKDGEKPNITTTQMLGDQSLGQSLHRLKVEGALRLVQLLGHDELAERLVAFALNYYRLDSAMRSVRTIDFDDLITCSFHLLTRFKEPIAFARRKFRHILVDEMQDTSGLQYLLVRAIAPPALFPTTSPSSTLSTSPCSSPSSTGSSTVTIGSGSITISDTHAETVLNERGGVLSRWQPKAESRSLMVVGDPNQNIFQWRYVTPSLAMALPCLHILEPPSLSPNLCPLYSHCLPYHFLMLLSLRLLSYSPSFASSAAMQRVLSDYPSSFQVQLRLNYRSTQRIIEMANAVIGFGTPNAESNYQRTIKAMEQIGRCPDILLPDAFSDDGTLQTGNMRIPCRFCEPAVVGTAPRQMTNQSPSKTEFESHRSDRLLHPQPCYTTSTAGIQPLIVECETPKQEACFLFRAILQLTSPRWVPLTESSNSDNNQHVSTSQDDYSIPTSAKGQWLPPLYRPRDIAILYRTRQQGKAIQAIFDELNKSVPDPTRLTPLGSTIPGHILPMPDVVGVEEHIAISRATKDTNKDVTRRPAVSGININQPLVISPPPLPHAFLPGYNPRRVLRYSITGHRNPVGTQDVKAMLALIRLAINPDDSLSFRTALTTIRKGLRSEQVDNLFTLLNSDIFHPISLPTHFNSSQEDGFDQNDRNDPTLYRDASLPTVHLTLMDRVIILIDKYFPFSDASSLHSINHFVSSSSTHSHDPANLNSTSSFDTLPVLTAQIPGILSPPPRPLLALSPLSMASKRSPSPTSGPSKSAHNSAALKSTGFSFQPTPTSSRSLSSSSSSSSSSTTTTTRNVSTAKVLPASVQFWQSLMSSPTSRSPDNSMSSPLPTALPTTALESPLTKSPNNSQISTPWSFDTTDPFASQPSSSPSNPSGSPPSSTTTVEEITKGSVRKTSASKSKPPRAQGHTPGTKPASAKSIKVGVSKKHTGEDKVSNAMSGGGGEKGGSRQLSILSMASSLPLTNLSTPTLTLSTPPLSSMGSATTTTSDKDDVVASSSLTLRPSSADSGSPSAALESKPNKGPNQQSPSLSHGPYPPPPAPPAPIFPPSQHYSTSSTSPLHQPAPAPALPPSSKSSSAWSAASHTRINNALKAKGLPTLSRSILVAVLEVVLVWLRSRAILCGAPDPVGHGQRWVDHETKLDKLRTSHTQKEVKAEIEAHPHAGPNSWTHLERDREVSTAQNSSDDGSSPALNQGGWVEGVWTDGETVHDAVYFGDGVQDKGRQSSTSDGSEMALFECVEAATVVRTVITLTDYKGQLIRRAELKAAKDRAARGGLSGPPPSRPMGSKRDDNEDSDASAEEENENDLGGGARVDEANLAAHLVALDDFELSARKYDQNYRADDEQDDRDDDDLVGEMEAKETSRDTSLVYNPRKVKDWLMLATDAYAETQRKKATLATLSLPDGALASRQLTIKAEAEVSAVSSSGTWEPSWLLGIALSPSLSDTMARTLGRRVAAFAAECLLDPALLDIGLEENALNTLNPSINQPNSDVTNSNPSSGSLSSHALTQITSRDLHSHQLSQSSVSHPSISSPLPSSFASPNSMSSSLSSTQNALLGKTQESPNLATSSMPKPKRTIDSTDIVTLTTIHGAKGLEWPIVFLVGCQDGTLPTGCHVTRAQSDACPNLDNSENLCVVNQARTEEERMLTYVALTRAKERLVLTFSLCADLCSNMALFSSIQTEKIGGYLDSKAASQPHHFGSLPPIHVQSGISAPRLVEWDGRPKGLGFDALYRQPAVTFNPITCSPQLSRLAPRLSRFLHCIPDSAAHAYSLALPVILYRKVSSLSKQTWSSRNTNVQDEGWGNRWRGIVNVPDSTSFGGDHPQGLVRPLKPSDIYDPYNSDNELELAPMTPGDHRLDYRQQSASLRPTSRSLYRQNNSVEGNNRNSINSQRSDSDNGHGKLQWQAGLWLRANLENVDQSPSSNPRGDISSWKKGSGRTTTTRRDMNSAVAPRDIPSEQIGLPGLTAKDEEQVTGKRIRLTQEKEASNDDGITPSMKKQRPNESSFGGFETAATLIRLQTTPADTTFLSPSIQHSSQRE